MEKGPIQVRRSHRSRLVLRTEIHDQTMRTTKSFIIPAFRSRRRRITFRPVTAIQPEATTSLDPRHRRPLRTRPEVAYRT